MKLSKKILSLCKEKKWSLAQLSRESGVPHQTIHNWTVGRKSLNPLQLKQVSDALQVSMHQLLFDEPDPYESTGNELLKEIFSGDVRVTLHKIERKVRS